MFSDRVRPSSLFRLNRMRGGWVLGIVALVMSFGLVACDSNDGGPPPSDLEGRYVFEEFIFVTQGSGIDNFNILQDTLVTDTANVDPPRMEFFGRDATVDLIYVLDVQDGRSSSRTPGQFSTGRGRVTVDFKEASEEKRFELLLPQVIQFERQEDGDRLVANQERRNVDISRYSPGRFGGLNQPVDGRLHMELERVQTQ